ncbi:histidine phosphatase family protein [Candidatus Enterococcus willemsii]|uniref:Phosphoglycerate mutase n=1 Tax=Candidatus Enterococcus willemsii TaxID=1857215 RepID=A0ABQ6YXK0_9ENTE|nr:hypothetical protein BAU17_05305 [Enterococcus sp. CU12B]
MKLSVIAFLIIFLLGACGKNNEKTEEAKEEPITIYLVRHGKTFFNTTGQTQGWSDTPLTDVGEKQAEQVGKGLSEVKFVTAYSSDLGRQRKTAELILKNNENKVPELQEHIGFREFFYGGFEGSTDEEVMQIITEKTGIANWEEVTADDIAAADDLGLAETTKEVNKRAKEAMTQVIEEAEKLGGGNVLIVSSGGMIPVLLEAVLPDNYQGENIGNGSVTTLTYQDGKYELLKIGDESYVENNQ